MAIPIPLLIAIAKTVGKEAAFTAATKYILPKAGVALTNIKGKVGEKATTASINHIQQNSTQLRNAGMKLIDKRTRSEGIAEVAKIGLGSVSAALAAKYMVDKEPKKDILAEQTASKPEQTQASSPQSQQEQTRIKNEQTQDFAVHKGFNR